MACIYGPFDCDICPKDEPAAAHEAPADCDGYEGAITTDRCLNCGQALYAHSNEALRTLFDINRRDGKPPDNSAPQAIPDTARRILDMGRTQQAAQPTYEQRREEIARRRNPQQSLTADEIARLLDEVFPPMQSAYTGIARAVDRLSQRDDAFMPCANEFHP
jgi:hypothetical protein